MRILRLLEATSPKAAIKRLLTTAAKRTKYAGRLFIKEADVGEGVELGGNLVASIREAGIYGLQLNPRGYLIGVYAITDQGTFVTPLLPTGISPEVDKFLANRKEHLKASIYGSEFLLEDRDAWLMVGSRSFDRLPSPRPVEEYEMFTPEKFLKYLSKANFDSVLRQYLSGETDDLVVRIEEFLRKALMPGSYAIEGTSLSIDAMRVLYRFNSNVSISFFITMRGEQARLALEHVSIQLPERLMEDKFSIYSNANVERQLEGGELVLTSPRDLRKVLEKLGGQANAIYDAMKEGAVRAIADAFDKHGLGKHSYQARGLFSWVKDLWGYVRMNQNFPHIVTVEFDDERSRDKFEKELNRQAITKRTFVPTTGTLGNQVRVAAFDYYLDPDQIWKKLKRSMVEARDDLYDLVASTISSLLK